MFLVVASAMLDLVEKLLQQLVIPTTRAPVRLFRVPWIASEIQVKQTKRMSTSVVAALKDFVEVLLQLRMLQTFS
jgi:hypothetical protein